MYKQTYCTHAGYMHAKKQSIIELSKRLKRVAIKKLFSDC